MAAGSKTRSLSASRASSCARSSPLRYGRIHLLLGIPTPETDWLDQQVTRQRLGLLGFVAHNYHFLRARGGRRSETAIDCLIARFGVL